MNYNIVQHSLQTECWQHMMENGLPCPDQIIADEKIRRYSADSQRNKPDEWYIAHTGIFKQNEYLVCAYGSWSTGSKYVFKSYDKLNISEQERQQLNAESEKKKLAADQIIKELHDKAAITAERLWALAVDTPPSQDYLTYPSLKNIQPIGAKFTSFKDTLRIILPLRGIDGKIRSLQSIYIDENGKTQKRFLTDGEKKGNFHTLGDLKDDNVIYFVEGWATGVSVYTAGLSPVIIAYDAGNLMPVIENVKGAFPKSELIIAGDSDEVGRKRAIAAADAFGGKAVFPEFPVDKRTDFDGNAYTDFNDLHQVCSLEEVHIQITRIASAPSTKESLKITAQKSLEKEDPCAKFSPGMLPKILGDYIDSICDTTYSYAVGINNSCCISRKTGFYIGG
ncbi:MAG: toprim domain-containing protein [Candidatus Babeliaceae bacterium]|nr:toprim domain-containing protein [Candidatus Babeliaceae bacterium]